MVKSSNFDIRIIRNRARELRHNMTGSEKLLWGELRNRKLAGHKFLRQHPIIYKGDLTRLHYFIADFYCSEKRLVVELDGGSHNDSTEYDNFRDSALKSYGIQTLRIKNEELADMDEACRKILSFINSMHK